MNFFNKIKLKLVNSIISTKWYHYTIIHIFPYIRFSTYYSIPANPKYSNWGALVADGYKLLKKGHIILCIDETNLSGKLIGKITNNKNGIDNDKNGVTDVLTHSAFVVGQPHYEVAEMTHLNFTKSFFSDLCFRSTRTVIIECTDFDKEYIAAMIKRTYLFEDAAYDVTYTMGGFESLACSALVYEYDFERRLDVSLEPLLGVKPYISPTGLYNAKNVKVIWDSNLVGI